MKEEEGKGRNICCEKEGNCFIEIIFRYVWIGRRDIRVLLYNIRGLKYNIYFSFLYFNKGNFNNSIKIKNIF